MRVALLGYGLAGEAFHAPFIAATDGLELATIITGNAERAAAARQRYPSATVTADAAHAWAADVVVVATPNRFHVSYAHEAIARGVPVIVDKPLAVSLHDVEVLLADLDAAGGKLTVFQNRRWDGDFLTARRLVSAGTLGATIRFTSRFIRFRPHVKDGWREGGDPRDGGGQLLDLGPHLIDQALLLLGPARSVYAEIGTLRPGAVTDDDAFVILEHEGGARSHLSMSAIAANPAPRMELTGTDGGFVSEGLDVQEAQLRAGLAPHAPSFGLNPPGTTSLVTGRREEPIERGAYAAFYAAIPDWAAGVGPAPVDPHDSRAVFAVIEAARQSAAARDVVALTPKT
jgi:predicted dehydrogenase